MTVLLLETSIYAVNNKKTFKGNNVSKTGVSTLIHSLHCRRTALLLINLKVYVMFFIQFQTVSLLQVSVPPSHRAVKRRQHVFPVILHTNRLNLEHDSIPSSVSVSMVTWLIPWLVTRLLRPRFFSLLFVRNETQLLSFL